MNKHITENINHYIELDNPEYAILLSGSWGSGKTYFIDTFIKNYLDKFTTGNKENKIKFIKISLFGLNVTEQIDEIIFQNLHPILGSKYAKFTGNMLRSAIKLGFNVDTDGDGDTDVKPTINLKEFSFSNDNKKSYKELVFIFDDLERTDIGLSEILGYINYLIEQLNFKVLIVANEEKIKKHKQFKEFKEKVIGKTFEVSQNLDEIFNNFCTLADKAKDILFENSEVVTKVFLIGNYNNLRHIRQAVLDFEYFYSTLDQKFIKQNELMNDMIYEFFLFSIEIKRGVLHIDNFKPFDYIPGLSQEETTTEMQDILKKYSMRNEYDLVLSLDLWRNILLRGNIDKNILNEKLQKSKYFMNETTESWFRLLHYRDLEDEEFKKYLDEVIDKFDNNKYIVVGTLLHVTALLLYFSKLKMCERKAKDIIKKAKHNIDENILKEEWTQENSSYKEDYSGMYGYTFYDNESTNFQKVLTYLEKKDGKLSETRLQDSADELLEYFKRNDIEKIKDIFSQDFYGIPIFSKIKVNDFVTMFQELEHKNISFTVRLLKERYKYYFNDSFIEELKFWKAVSKKICQGINSIDNPVKYRLLSSQKDFLFKEILDKLEEKNNVT